MGVRSQEDQGWRVSIEPRNMYSGGERIKLVVQASVESRQPACVGRQQTLMRSKYGEHWGHHRGLRPGHLFKGVVRELGRTESFPAKIEVENGETETKLLQALHSAQPCIESTEVVETRIAEQTGYRVRSDKRTSTRRAFSSLSGT